MKYKFLFLVTFLSFFLVSFSSQAQNTLDLFLSGGISKQRAGNSFLASRIAQAEDPGLAYRIGASYSARLSSRIYICVGGNYTSLSTTSTFDPADARWGTQWNGTAFDPTISSGEDFPKTTNTSRESQFEIPITIRYYMSDSERFYALLGIVPALHLRYVNVIKQDGGSREAVENTVGDFEDFQFATRIGLGADWPISEKIKVFTQVNGQVHLLEEVKNSGLRWWDVSCQLGLRLGI